MYITYHKEVKKKEQMGSIRHSVLCSKIRKYIEDKGVEQKYYDMMDNGFCMFLFLNNGNRIDISHGE